MRDMAELASAASQAQVPAMHPTAFAGLFGWLHQAEGTRADTGVVLISPLGRDARCAHRPMCALADQLAAAGFPTLRYDHRGEGDSLDFDDPDTDALPIWLEGIGQAVDQLRLQTGVQRVVLGGVRLGASLAALQAVRADGLLLLAPVLNGRAWLKRLRFSSRVVRTSTAMQADDLSIDSNELYLNAATAAGLAGFDLAQSALAQPAPASAPLVFVAVQNRLVRTWAEQLGDGSAPIAISDFPGFDDLFLDAHSNTPPTALFDSACDWMQRCFGPTFLEAAPVPATLTELRPPGAIERAAVFGDGLRGVVCRPHQHDPHAPAVLFCNTGGDPRAGIGGFATAAARRLAQRGVASLRFDFAGLGDSAPVAAGEPSHVYETPREADLEAALNFLEALGFQRVCVVGVCAGAYHALKLASRDPRVSRVFAVSPVKLIWRKGDSLAFGRVDDGKATQAYLHALRDPSTWGRMMQGGVDFSAVARTLYRRLGSHLLGLISKTQGVSPLADMRDFSRRGGQAHLLMGLDDASVDEVRIYFGPDAASLTALPGMSARIEPDLDHGLARSKSRAIALDALVGWLGAKS